MLNAELRTHLGYEKNQISTKGKDDNSRNGHSSKTVLTKDEEIELKIPRGWKLALSRFVIRLKEGCNCEYKFNEFWDLLQRSDFPSLIKKNRKDRLHKKVERAVSTDSVLPSIYD